MPKAYLVVTYRAIKDKEKMVRVCQARRACDPERRRALHRAQHAGEDV